MIPPARLAAGPTMSAILDPMPMLFAAHRFDDVEKLIERARARDRDLRGPGGVDRAERLKWKDCWAWQRNHGIGAKRGRCPIAKTDVRVQNVFERLLCRRVLDDIRVQQIIADGLEIPLPGDRETRAIVFGLDW